MEDPDVSLINLLNKIAVKYLSDCTTAILYDNFTNAQEKVFLSKLFQQYPLIQVHGTIPTDYHIQIGELINQPDQKCVHFIIFVKDVMKCQDVVSKRSEKVVIVAKSTQWRVQEYLNSEFSREIANLLVIVKSEKYIGQKQEAPYILYTHKLFVDALGSSQPVVITSWSEGNFTRNVELFQPKLKHGFSGHRFIIATAHQPPYVIKTKRNERDETEYSGIEIQLVNLLSKMYNFSTDFKESSETEKLGSGEAVIKTLKGGNINMGIAGIYITDSRYNAGTLNWHGEDCAAFISLASTALPRYRAIMGPFHWSVWLALIGVYIGSIPLFSYSERLTLKYLLSDPLEFENMFWYVFGTFTNCFTFTGTKSWTKANKGVTKILVGIYWLFTIIITACYTGSIIAFVTLPVFPAAIDTVEQLLNHKYQIGMLDKGGWPTWFKNVTGKNSEKILSQVDYVPTVESGLVNVTKAFFWPYAMLGSREELQFIVKTNFTMGSKKALLHITQQCFVPFKVGILLPSHSVYSEIIAEGVQMILQSGFYLKMKSDVEWDMLRSATGKLLAANSHSGGLKMLPPEDRALTLDDTQGMFLLLAAGYIAGAAILLSEIFGGCFNLCKQIKISRIHSSNSSIPSNPRFHERQINREWNRETYISEIRRRSASLKSGVIELGDLNAPLHKASKSKEVENKDFEKCREPYEAEISDIEEKIGKLFNEALSVDNGGGSTSSVEKNMKENEKNN
ncbi:ionotropic receptor 21a [Euwallacea fornicatus]|uniref:ionotropic receptor 21a n=1 Tax=Euwallacea fornicatus TaxID=995702 RepID=UPI00338EB134